MGLGSGSVLGFVLRRQAAGQGPHECMQQWREVREAQRVEWLRLLLLRGGGVGGPAARRGAVKAAAEGEVRVAGHVVAHAERCPREG